MNADQDRQDAVIASGGATARTPAGDAFSELIVRVLRLHGLLTAAGDAIARPVGQSSARWQVLAMIEGESHSVAETARTLGLARQSVQRVADLLAAAGLIVYEENPRHRRAQLMTLTDDGRRTLAAIQARQRPWADAIGSAAGLRRLGRANDDLDRVLAALLAAGPVDDAADPVPASGSPAG
jgi:DNA-binding MarR family transcriptional regulator